MIFKNMYHIKFQVKIIRIFISKNFLKPALFWTIGAVANAPPEPQIRLQFFSNTTSGPKLSWLKIRKKMQMKQTHMTCGELDTIGFVP